MSNPNTPSGRREALRYNLRVAEQHHHTVVNNSPVVAGSVPTPFKQTTKYDRRCVFNKLEKVLF